MGRGWWSVDRKKMVYALYALSRIRLSQICARANVSMPYTTLSNISQVCREVIIIIVIIQNKLAGDRLAIHQVCVGRRHVNDKRSAMIVYST